MTRWQPILASIGIGVFVALMWAAMDALSSRVLGWDRTHSAYVTTAFAAANGAWLMWLWS